MKKPWRSRVEEETSLGHLVSTLPLENDRYDAYLEKRRRAQRKRRAKKKKR